MDWSHDHTANSVHASKDRGNALDYGALSSLDLHSPGVSSSYSSGQNKKKHGAADHPISFKDVSSMVLGVAPSSSSCTSTCLKTIIEDESSLDLGLSINLNPSGNRFSTPKNVSGCLDLQLSLSTGPMESDTTTLTAQEFRISQNHSELPAFATAVQLVDEGSTSSRWKAGPLITPLMGREIPAVPHQDVDVVGKPKRRLSVKPCMFEGCTRGARGASGLCIAHGGGRRCQKAGCQRGAEGKTVFCKAHGGGRRCQYLGCTKSAEGRTDYCIGHGGGKRCTHDGCSRAARGKSGLCIRHGGGKRCKIGNCIRSAEGVSGLCISHGGGRRCQFPECGKGAQGSTMFCKAHGGGRRCTFLGCTKGAEGSTPFCKGHGGGKRCTANGCTKSVHGGTLFCVGHGGGKRCAVPECTKSARGRTNYCVRHGGGKRCKSEGCPKSAQGSTDFCKAHGGGRRCSWAGPAACDKFARGKSGLCAAHATQMQGMEKEKEMSSTTGFTGTTTSFGSTSYVTHSFALQQQERRNLALPEGRVHGGRLMAILRGDAEMEEDGMSQLEVDKSIHMAHKWV
ncbi:uncharacterized protein LOC127256228 [Andrographis paniculata]|uniref:uncharacterized protein LOC127256228 n=1 Tax=Andrographis paniculata TaxID=175694 RepID=UPI0021E94AB0|nr:uncharacterized protein LOC127256228 [Andrographis paniculata]XP_051138076.1 uncharacterized protein LOC127256228 [Andrographis paniculata]XP_051138077.1 uncharacterized protein LOC127256228 [Andrographis paniculata]